MFYPLMLLETAQSPFSSSDFIFEQKYDGIRLEYSNIDQPLLYTRNHTLVNNQFPELLIHPPRNVILDGEILWFNSTENEDFEGIMKRFLLKKDSKILQEASTHPITYLVFDILYYQGKDLRSKSLLERKDILKELVFDNPYIGKVQSIDTNGLDLFQQIKEANGEGIVAKRKASPYIGARTGNWLKIIHWIEAEAIIYAYRKKDHALLCLHQDGRHMGLVTSGMNRIHREAFFKIAKGIQTAEDKEYFYLEPLLRCKLKGRGFTVKGTLRSAIFVDFIF